MAGEIPHAAPAPETPPVSDPAAESTARATTGSADSDGKPNLHISPEMLEAGLASGLAGATIVLWELALRAQGVNPGPPVLSMVAGEHTVKIDVHKALEESWVVLFKRLAWKGGEIHPMWGILACTIGAPLVMWATATPPAETENPAPDIPRARQATETAAEHAAVNRPVYQESRERTGYGFGGDEDQAQGVKA